MKRGTVSMGASSFLRRLHTTIVPLMVLVVAALGMALNAVPMGFNISTAMANDTVGYSCGEMPITYGCTFIVDETELLEDQPCVGTSERDVIFGSEGNDVISGLGGSDIIKGRGGDDIICGDEGNDNLKGNDGNDWLDGGAGNDTLQGNKGWDTCLNGENIKKGCEPEDS